MELHIAPLLGTRNSLMWVGVKDRVCTLLSDFLSVVCRVVEQVRDVGLDGVVFVR